MRRGREGRQRDPILMRAHPLVELQRELGISGRRWAQALGITPQYYRNICSGDSGVSRPVIDAIGGYGVDTLAFKERCEEWLEEARGASRALVRERMALRGREGKDAAGSGA